MSSESAALGTVKQFVLDEFLAGEDPSQLTPTTPLMSSGVLDSLATLKLITFLEKEFGIRIDAHEADEEHFDTLEKISQLVDFEAVSALGQPARELRAPATTRLHAYLEQAARQWPDRVAVQEADGSSVSYRELAELSDRLRDRLVALGVRPGDRVGFWLRKSIDAIATIFGVLKTGAAYVPVDPGAPPTRNGYIFADCQVTAVVVESRFEAALRAELDQQGAAPRFLVLDGSGGGGHLRAALAAAEGQVPAPSPTVEPTSDDDLAYILYTSGSTGKPKGVQLSHVNATSFVEWCADMFAPGPEDRFSSHAPLHFDLSILDVFCALRAGSALVLVPDHASKNPEELASLIADQRITIWYSAPSILSLLAQFGDLGSRDYSALRLVLFAGEVFPITHLKSLVSLWPRPRYFNLYGPTETNVCTWYEVPTPIAADRSEPVPIGKVCAHLEGIILDEEGAEVGCGQEGELCIRGWGVTRGYWNLPEQSARAFVTAGAPPPYYRTGDVVRAEPDGNLRYLGRRDRMIKKRGYRVELGEIETCLYSHPDIGEAAVVALPDSALGMKVFAHVAGKTDRKLSVIELKIFCSRRIPVYMIPDSFVFHRALPKTSTDKIDYKGLETMP